MKKVIKNHNLIRNFWFSFLFLSIAISFCWDFIEFKDYNGLFKSTTLYCFLLLMIDINYLYFGVFSFRFIQKDKEKKYYKHLLIFSILQLSIYFLIFLTFLPGQYLNIKQKVIGGVLAIPPLFIILPVLFLSKNLIKYLKIICNITVVYCVLKQIVCISGKIFSIVGADFFAKYNKLMPKYNNFDLVKQIFMPMLFMAIIILLQQKIEKTEKVSENTMLSEHDNKDTIATDENSGDITMS